MCDTVAWDFILRRIQLASFPSKRIALIKGVSTGGHPSSSVLSQYVVSVIIFLLCLCCTTTSHAASLKIGDAEKMKLTKNDNGRNISISIGSIIEIELSTPAGTGYEWSVAKLDQEYLELIKEETIVTQTDGDKVGQPVVKKWYLRAQRCGVTEVIMGLYRSWEGKDRPGDLFDIHIDISLMTDKER